MADAADSKSAARECVRVRVPPPAPLVSDIVLMGLLPIVMVAFGLSHIVFLFVI